MALTDASRESELSLLSVEAANFVPSARDLDRSTQACLPTVIQIQQLPNYMTNCYPFVTVDPGFQPRPSSGQGFVNVPANSHVPVMRAPSGSGATCLQASPQLINGHMCNNRNVPFHAIPPPAAPVQFNTFPPPSYVRVLDVRHPQSTFVPLGMASPAGLPFPTGNVPQQMVFPGENMPTINNFSTFQPGTVQWVSQPVPVADKPTYMQRQGFLQSGVGVSGHANKSGKGFTKHDARTKVLVCRENSCQTDFNDELARSSLSERPNSFYRSGASVISETAESDSGYSSPQHRQMGTSTTPRVSMAASPSNLRVNTVTAAYGQQKYLSDVAMVNTNIPPPLSLFPHQQNGHMQPAAYQPPAAYQFVRYPFIRQVMPQSQPQPRGFNLQPRYPPLYRDVRAPMAAQASAHLSTRHSASRSAVNYRQPPHPTPRFVGSVAAAEVRPQLEPVKIQQQQALPFGDVDEFPILLSAADGLVALHGAGLYASPISMNKQPSAASPIRPGSAEPHSADGLTSSRQRRISNRSSASETHAVSPPSKVIPGLYLTEKELKAARKKLKRQEIANRAAEKELAEISLEQQVLRELRVKQVQKAPDVGSPVPDTLSNEVASKVENPSNEPIATEEVSNMLANKEMSGDESNSTMVLKSELPEVDSVENLSVAAQISCDPLLKRCKDREAAVKSKKPSTLKKVILKEREEMKRHKLVDEDDDADQCALVLEGGIAALPYDQFVNPEPSGSPPSGDVSPVSQMSPFNMSPLSGSPAGSAGASPIAGDGMLGTGYGPGSVSIAAKIHSRRFREYCNQVLDKEIDECCTRLLQDLVRSQDRGYSKDPSKVKRKIVMGLREVTKHLKLNQLKCIIISPNMERIQSKGGLDEALNHIIELSRQQNVPFVFALGRRALGRVCAKLVPVSIVGIFCYEGTEENFQQLCQLTEKARKAYSEMVLSLEQEMAASVSVAPSAAANNPDQEASLSGAVSAPRYPMTGNLGGFEKLFPHLGHSRTPSACSAISIISSVLSEPASENYPASDPDTDVTRVGNDVKDAVLSGGRKVTDLDTVGESREEGIDGLPDCGDKSSVGERLHGDIDEGHEADTEDGSESRSSRVHRQTLTPKTGSTSGRVKSEGSSEREQSIKAVSNLVALELPFEEPPKVVLEHTPTPQRPPAIDSERIESWVVESRKAIENMRANDADNLFDDEVGNEEDIGDIDAADEPTSPDNCGLAVDSAAVDKEDDEDDVVSMKTVGSGSSTNSDYVEACDE